MTGLFLDVCKSMALPGSIVSGFLADLVPVSSWPVSRTGGFLKGFPGEKIFVEGRLPEDMLGLEFGILVGLIRTLSGFLAGLLQFLRGLVH